MCILFAFFIDSGRGELILLFFAVYARVSKQTSIYESKQGELDLNES